MWTKKFWKAATERAMKTAAQTAVLILGADGFDAIAVDWLDVGGFVLGGVILSFLTSLGSDALTSSDGPAAFGPETIPPKHRAVDLAVNLAERDALAARTAEAIERLEKRIEGGFYRGGR